MISKQCLRSTVWVGRMLAVITLQTLTVRMSWARRTGVEGAGETEQSPRSTPQGPPQGPPQRQPQGPPQGHLKDPSRAERPHPVAARVV